jgi:hypothetical protein
VEPEPTRRCRQRIKRILVLTTLLLATLVASAGAVGPSPGVAPVLTVGDEQFSARVDGFDTVLRTGDVTNRIADRWGFPRVAYDGSVEGLSEDGKTLVLSEVTDNQLVSPTRFLVVSPKTLAVRKRLSLPGRFAFDALSPRADRLYLIEYVTVLGQLRYRVRVADLRTGKLLERVIADKRSRWTTMEGMPLARVVGDGGRWVYTLYGMSSAKTFVHALNAADGYALCIDLPLAADDVGSLRLGGGRLSVLDRAGVARAAVDTTTFKVLRS